MAATHGVHVGKTRPLTGWRAGGRAAYYPPWNCPFFFHDSLGDEATRVFSPSSHAFVKRFHPILVRSSSLRFEEKLKIVRNFFSFFFLETNDFLESISRRRDRQRFLRNKSLHFSCIRNEILWNYLLCVPFQKFSRWTSKWRREKNREREKWQKCWEIFD